MAKFRFTAVDQKGKESSGTIEAAGESQAFETIRKQGLFPTSVVLESKGKSAPAAKRGGKSSAGKSRGGKSAGSKSPRAKSRSGKAKGGKKGVGSKEINLNIPGMAPKIKPKDMMVFTRQLATLVDAGLPLVRGLEVLDKQEKNPTMKKALNSMIDAVNSGSTFAESLEAHPKIFDKLFVNMVRAGEVGGVLDTVLLNLSVFMEKAEKIKSKVKSAMVYPMVVLGMAIGIVVFLMIFIIPKFQKIFDDVLEGKPLPPLTQFVVAMSEGLTQKLPQTIITLVVVIIIFKVMARTKQGRYLIDAAKLKMPAFGPLFVKTGIARFSRTLGTLMNSGVPVLQALTIVRETAGNEMLAKAVNTIHDSVKEGENMAPPIESTKIFPPMVVGMVEVGEETGELPQMLTRVADNYEEEVDNAVDGITSIIEPVLIVFLAVIVGTIVIALFMPLIGIITELSG